MSDNNILFDSDYVETMKQYMLSQGYKAVSVSSGNHDVYEKMPVYNFELHRSLYGSRHPNEWEAYYREIKKHLIQDEGTLYAYHMSKDDFYVYIVCHTMKHYQGSGTGIRSLLDFYVYLKKEEECLNFAYIEKQCQMLRIREFERCCRQLSKRIFSDNVAAVYDQEQFERNLSEEEKQLLFCCLTSGVHGNFETMMENRLEKYRKEDGSISKFGYIKSRLFPGEKFISDNYPFFTSINI